MSQRTDQEFLIPLAELVAQIGKVRLGAAALQQLLDSYFASPLRARPQLIAAQPLLAAFFRVLHSIDFRGLSHRSWLQRFLRETGIRFTRKQVFELVYEHSLWGGGESASGSGSHFEGTQAVRTALPTLLSHYGIKSIVDAACGDFHWMKELATNKQLEIYYGIDIVSPLIESIQLQHGSDKIQFLAMDLVTNAPPKADLILCRHLFIHLSNDDCLAVMENFRASGARYLLISTMPSLAVNAEVAYTGSYRPVNLELPPFRLAERIDAINDSQSADDSTVLGLYRLR